MSTLDPRVITLTKTRRVPRVPAVPARKLSQTVYRTPDGKEFDTPWEANNHLHAMDRFHAQEKILRGARIRGSWVWLLHAGQVPVVMEKVADNYGMPPEHYPDWFHIEIDRGLGGTVAHLIPKAQQKRVLQTRLKDIKKELAILDALEDQKEI